MIPMKSKSTPTNNDNKNDRHIQTKQTAMISMPSIRKLHCVAAPVLRLFSRKFEIAKKKKLRTEVIRSTRKVLGITNY